MSQETPDLIDTLEAWFLAHSQDTHTAFPARVQAYNAAKRTADLVPLIKRAVETEAGEIVSEDYPVLPNVPILFPGSGAYRITFPVAAGDLVLAVCCEASIGHVRATGEVTEPGDLRRHHLSHAVALPGFFASSGVQAAPTDAIVIGQDGLTAQFVALANLVDSRLSTIQGQYDIHTHGETGATTTLPTPLINSLPSTAAAKVKAT